MTPTIRELKPRLLIGKRMDMTMDNFPVRDLWQSFLPRVREVPHKSSQEFFSVSVYPTAYFMEVNPHQIFQKWAAVEVSQIVEMPEGLELLSLPGGLYAVFIHKGGASAFVQTATYIHRVWLPGSGYRLDDRPHFEILGEHYKNNDPDSEEEVWIPVTPRI